MACDPTPFDLVDLLDSDEAIQEYLSQVLADGDVEETIQAQAHVQTARAQNAGS